MRKLITLFFVQGIFLILESYFNLIADSEYYSWFSEYPEEFPLFTLIIGVLLVIAAIGFIEKRYYGYYIALIVYVMFSVGAILKVFFDLYSGELTSIFIGVSIIALLIFVVRSISELEEDFSTGNKQSLDFTVFIVLFYGVALMFDSFHSLAYISHSMFFFTTTITYIVVILQLLLGIIIVLVSVGLMARDKLAYSLGFYIFIAITFVLFLNSFLGLVLSGYFNFMTLLIIVPILAYVSYYMNAKMKLNRSNKALE